MTNYQYRFSFGYGLTPVIKKLLIIMAAVFFLQTMVSDQITLYLGLVPYSGLESLFCVATVHIHLSSRRALPPHFQSSGPLDVRWRTGELLGIQKGSHNTSSSAESAQDSARSFSLPLQQ